MVFMKGNKDEPKCKFSKALMEILKEEKLVASIISSVQHAYYALCSVEFDTFDILQDQEVREQLKVYSNWPTYPQVYAKGELVGGLDIIKVLYF